MNEIDSSGRPGFHKHIAALVIYGDAFAVDSHHFRLTRQCISQHARLTQDSKRASVRARANRCRFSTHPFICATGLDLNRKRARTFALIGTKAHLRNQE